MAKHALSLFIKIALFSVVMLIVSEVIPYDGLVSAIIGLFDFQSASNFTRLILGEPDLEVWESLHIYFSILINTLISVPVMSAIITAYSGVTHKVSPANLPENWILSTLRRLAKLFAFTLLFWLPLRFLPYQVFFPDRETYSALIITAIMTFNLLLTVACYGVVMNKITIKRSL
ncbi:Uncharacterised protein [Raoultella terrigena]|jgi:hypothetical protein|uniref:Uncharacterized protein n=1 Tax=Raoultella terrigena TaxID=577 RepID=A0A4U9D586_RAOTE|nr:Uncharacterised protein [Raoultella terrigena]